VAGDPEDLPPKSTIYDYFTCDYDGTLEISTTHFM